MNSLALARALARNWFFYSGKGMGKGMGSGIKPRLHPAAEGDPVYPVIF